MNATRKYAILAAVAASLGVSACSGSSSSPVSPISAAPSAVPSVSSATAQVAYGASLMNGATYVKRASTGSIGANVVMKMKDPGGLIAYAKAANDPKNALYRRWLTPQELGDRFGTDAATYAATAKYLLANGILVKTYPQRQSLRILGPQANVERALGVQFGVFKKKSMTFVAPISAPHPSTSLHITALGNVVHLQTKSRRFLTIHAANSFVDGYSPQQIANGFDFTGAYAAGYKGDGITIGIIGTGPITDGDPRIAGGDVAEFRTLYGISGTGTVTQDVDTMNVSPGYANGPVGDQYSTGLATPPPVTSPAASGCAAQDYFPGDSAPLPGSNFDYTTCNPEDIEAQLDTEQAAGLAPNANVNFYIAYNPMECFGVCNSTNPNYPGDQEIGLTLSDDEIQQAIADNKSDVLTMSFGEGEDAAQDVGYFGAIGSDPTQGYGPVELASLASMGTALFASAGDAGAEECQDADNIDTPCTAYPATDPSVVSVGGVNAPFDSSGRLTGPITGWGTATQIYNPSNPSPGGSGGGCSMIFSAPAYAAGHGLPCGTKRSQPDIALDADTNTGVAAVIDAAPGLGGRGVFDIGGTSAAAPEAAAMWALVLEACKNTSACAAKGSGATPYRLGNPDALLYPVYSNSGAYAATFYDVLFGNNAQPPDQGFNAGKGYDQVTGLGAPFGAHLITSILAQAES